MLLDAVALFVLGDFFTKLVLTDQIAIDQQFNRVVQGRTLTRYSLVCMVANKDSMSNAVKFVTP